jgi:PPM family protein phosphatase
MRENMLPHSARSNAFQTAMLSAVGGRESNQDSCDWRQVNQHACWVVADGLGGHKAGELASETAVRVVLDSFSRNPECSRHALQVYISAAQSTLRRLQEENTALTGMRTTLVALVTDSKKVLWAHIGDSRLYQFQSCRLVARTEDHSVLQVLVNSGSVSSDAVRGHSDRNRLLRSLGNSGSPQPTVLEQSRPLCVGDVFLLCTDGFWEYVLETEMLADLAASSSPEQWLERSELRLLRRVSGKHDNYSAIAVFFEPEPPGDPATGLTKA